MLIPPVFVVSTCYTITAFFRSFTKLYAISNKALKSCFPLGLNIVQFRRSRVVPVCLLLVPPSLMYVCYARTSFVAVFLKLITILRTL